MELQFDHKLKSWPHLFAEFVTGNKKHDLRDIRDREFKVGQTVLLQEWNPDGTGYTGREIPMRITYITDKHCPCALSSMALDKGVALLSLQEI